jgi:peptidoglycan/xylan/chitin deacetylase (PgdA/CDA1 family)
MMRLLNSQRRTQVANTAKWAGGRLAVTLHRAFGDRDRDRFGILMYHRVVPHRRDAAPPDTVSPARFRAQLEGLLERDFQFARLGDVVALSERGERMPPRSVVVTFDDGFANVHEHALPVLADLGIPATVFVVTSFIGSSEPFPFDPWAPKARHATASNMWRPLDWAACKELDESGIVDIGSHTHTHADFRGRPEAFEHDVRASLESLQSHLGPGPRAFAFPFGARAFASSELKRAAACAGVTCALTTEIELADPRGDRYAWGRVEAVESDSATVCASKLTGWYNWMGVTRRTFQRVSSR